jgi:hypothetical protein
MESIKIDPTQPYALTPFDKIGPDVSRKIAGFLDPISLARLEIAGPIFHKTLGKNSNENLWVDSFNSLHNPSIPWTRGHKSAITLQQFLDSTLKTREKKEIRTIQYDVREVIYSVTSRELSPALLLPTITWIYGSIFVEKGPCPLVNYVSASILARMICACIPARNFTNRFEQETQLYSSLTVCIGLMRYYSVVSLEPSVYNYMMIAGILSEAAKDSLNLLRKLPGIRILNNLINLSVIRRPIQMINFVKKGWKELPLIFKISIASCDYCISHMLTLTSIPAITPIRCGINFYFGKADAFSTHFIIRSDAFLKAAIVYGSGLGIPAVTNYLNNNHYAKYQEKISDIANVAAIVLASPLLRMRNGVNAFFEAFKPMQIGFDTL